MRREGEAIKRLRDSLSDGGKNEKSPEWWWVPETKKIKKKRNKKLT